MIEIDKEYTITNTHKKCFAEVERFVHRDNPEKWIEVERLYRWGSIDITPRTQEEVERLEEILEGVDEFIFTEETFICGEFNSSWDGDYDLYSFSNSFTNDEKEHITETLEIDIDDEGYYTILTEFMDYDATTGFIKIYDGVSLEES